MKAIEFLQSEHRAIGKIVGRLEKFLEDSQQRKKTDLDMIPQVVKQIAALQQMILIHVIAEDADFYPRVARCGDQQLQEQITKLKQQTGDIEKRFDRFLVRWSRFDRKKDLQEACGEEASNLVKVLYARIQEEERIFVILREKGIDLAPIDIYWNSRTHPGIRVPTAVK